jgi:hypothetical protein|tara:strand:- start:503 stop:793 length:291 start_codon:yes stop_codon:yes gene_type:complete
VDNLSIEISEFLEQIDYALSFEFRDKWKHRFSTSFVNIFQQKIITALKRQKPFKLSTLVATYTRKFNYGPDYVDDFFSCINVRLYRPLVIDDRKVK